MTSAFFSWIQAHINDRPADLRLKFAGKPSPEGIDIPFAILQIECRRKCARKLARTLSLAPEFIFPTALSAEQCSSDTLADFHASLIPAGAKTGVDLTAGLGIDALTIARNGVRMTAIDRAPELTDALRSNAKALGCADSLTAVNADCREWLAEAIARGEHYDFAFIDPARRSDDGGRLFALEACAPDVVAMLPEIARVCDTLIIKASPMLDVSHTAAELTPPGASRIIAAGTATECKELIAIVEFTHPADAPTIEAATLLADGSRITFAFTAQEEREAPATPTGPGIAKGMFIHEPYPATMKSGARNCLAQRFSLFGFAANTRLFYAPMPAEGFPGEYFKVIDVQDYASRNIKRFARTYPSISITARNFGLTAEELRRKLGVKDGDGQLRLFAVSEANGDRKLIVCQRV